jgi:serine/threonine protein kinase
MHFTFIKHIFETPNSSVSSVSDEFGNLFVCKKTKINDFPLVSSLDNKYIIKYLHSFTDKTNIMNFIMKQYSFDLFEIIEDTKLLTRHNTKIYFSKLVVGLDYLFKKKIIHFDLKPENILIEKTPGKDDSIVIADFGSCYQVDDINTLIFDKIIGTYEYCSPEMLNNSGFNYKTDIYSLGLVLCEMAIRDHVFKTKSSDPFELARLKKKKNKGISSSVKYIHDPDLKDLVLQMTHINPAERIDIEDIKKHPFLSSVDWSLL